LNWKSLCAVIQLENPLYELLVELLVMNFDVIYKWSFDTAADQELLKNFRDNVCKHMGLKE
jgi:hypothetical protein